MEFTAAGIFNRAITIERTNTDIYKTQKETDVYVNGEKVLTTDRNVFTLADLEPDQDVTVKIDDVSHTFHTRKETVKLNVKDFGAKADGKTDDTNAIQAAIMNCPKDGSVYHASTRIHKEQDRVWRFAVLLLSDMIIILLRRIRMMCMCSVGMIRYRKNKE